MRTAIVFVVGLVIGSALAPGFAQDTRVPGVNNMNHVAIVVPNLVDAIAFYTQKMGFKEGFTVKNDQGQPTLSYIQVSRDTFIEPADTSFPGAGQARQHGLTVVIVDLIAQIDQRRDIGVQQTHDVLTVLERGLRQGQDVIMIRSACGDRRIGASCDLTRFLPARLIHGHIQ